MSSHKPNSLIVNFHGHDGWSLDGFESGTTYSVAAAMLQESLWANEEAHQEGESRGGGRHIKEEAEFLRFAAFETARGLYETGTYYYYYCCGWCLLMWHDA